MLRLLSELWSAAALGLLLSLIHIWGSAQKLTIHVPQLVCDGPDAAYLNDELAAMYAAEYRDYESYPQAEEMCIRDRGVVLLALAQAVVQGFGLGVVPHDARFGQGGDLDAQFIIDVVQPDVYKRQLRILCKAGKEHP